MIKLSLFCEELKNEKSNSRKVIMSIIHDLFMLVKQKSKKREIFFSEWEKDFRYIYGDTNHNLSSNYKLHRKEFLSAYGIFDENNTDEDLLYLFFSIQTFVSLLIKTLIQNILDKECKEIISISNDTISGKFSEKYGVLNYAFTDYYTWPKEEKFEDIADIITKCKNLLECYIERSKFTDFSCTNSFDYIKQIYESIIPKELRHALGEYYTPDWLAEKVVNDTICLDDKQQGKNLIYIDPTCGSGTFLCKVIKNKREEGHSLQEITESVYGCDINPLAVLTAKTNYLLSIMDLLSPDNPINIPIFNVDIIHAFDESEPTNDDLFDMRESEPQTKTEDVKKFLMLPKADIVIGNPPWVNWEYMPQIYRRKTQHLWQDYLLFSQSGRDLSFSKEDISVLITYIVLDKCLRDNGLLAFVIRQGVFKSAQNGVGFRRFKIKNDTDLKVIQVDDLSQIKVFDGASTSTSVCLIRKGIMNSYPVPYYVWNKKDFIKRMQINNYSTITEVLSQVQICKQIAMPTVKEDKTSLWLTSSQNNLDSIKKVLGKNQYRARTGIFTGGANAVYWVNITNSDEKFVSISNITERAKRKVEKTQSVIEKDFVYPLLKGSNISRWSVSYDTYLICPHTVQTKMWPVSHEYLQKNCSQTYTYLYSFKRELEERNGFAGWEKEIQQKEFHAILRIGDYTFSKYKIVWKYIATEFICAVISVVDDIYLGEKLLLPNEKVMYISTNDEIEAYYLCGVLSSTLISNCVKSYMNPTSISAHVLNKLNIPRFSRENIIQYKISQLCKEGHSAVDKNDYIRQIDELLPKLYQME